MLGWVKIYLHRADIVFEDKAESSLISRNYPPLQECGFVLTGDCNCGYIIFIAISKMTMEDFIVLFSPSISNPMVSINYRKQMVLALCQAH